MTPSAAARRIRKLTGAGRVRFTAHARERMFERDVSAAEVLYLLARASRCAAQESGCWLVSGDDAAVVVAVEANVLVVTVLRGDDDEDD